MDELTRVRELYGSPDHDPFMKPRVRALMSAAPRRRLPWRAGVAGLAAAAAVAAVAISVPGLVASTAAPSPSHGHSATSLSGHSILLAAADRAEAAPEGAYWHVKRLYSIRWAKPYGKPGDTYRLESSNIIEDWISEEGRAWLGSKSLAIRPLDAEAWRRDGSPTEWEGFATTPTEGILIPYEGNKKFQLGGAALTLEEVKALPSDPEALTNRTLEAIRANEDLVDDDLPRVLASLLYELPTTPEVRGAAYRALAALPAVRVEGDTTDPRGRPGVAITYPLQQGQGRLIIDPGTSMVLAFLVTGMPDKDVRTEVMLEAGWTDSKPVAPSDE
ncbi:CU044_5270 family protein [Streptosporangium lutulentum]|uniref:CU044_5270 family protein n=1 Tax=Streptosporangium lutulentum TaxID=1461250 RepID=A0ABT9QPM2_9ACTN|nr:CU044_5270 family protein [Streptosporangium lutulentum]MDP9848677.1 hypothetical protein [Streptosporangium lutulentum]